MDRWKRRLDALHGAAWHAPELEATEQELHLLRHVDPAPSTNGHVGRHARRRREREVEHALADEHAHAAALVIEGDGAVGVVTRVRDVSTLLDLRHVMLVDVDVARNGRPAHAVTIRQSMPYAVVEQLHAGGLVPLVVDRRDHETTRIDVDELTRTRG